MDPWLKSLTFSNFRSYYGTHRIDQFPTGLISVEGRNFDEGFSSNGGGKSSLIHVLSWSLYGVLSTGTSKDTLAYHGSSLVSSELECANLVIKRSKPQGSSEKLAFWTPTSGWVEKTDVRATQACLEQYLKLPRRIFYSSAWVDREAGAMQLLLATPGERLRIMQEVFSEDRYKALHADAKTYTGLCERDLTKHDRETESLKSKTEELRQVMYGVEQQILGEQKKAELAQASKVTALREELASAKTRLYRLEEEESRLRDAFPQVGRAASTRMELGRLDAQIQQLEALLAGRLYETGETCPSCGQALSAKAVSALKESRREQATKLQRLMNYRDDLQKKVVEAEGYEARLLQIVVDKVPYQQIITRVEQDLKLATQGTADNDTIAALQQQVISYRQRISACGADLFAMEMGRCGLEEAVIIAKEWERAFSPKGIPNLLLDRLRQSLSRYTREYLRKMSGAKYGVQFPVSDSGFDIQVQTALGVTELGAFSRGERWRINLALIAAFRKSLHQMYPSRVGFVVLDDVQDALDDVGYTRLYELARMLSQEVPHVFMASPQALTEMEDGARIIVEKKNECSRIVEVRMG